MQGTKQLRPVKPAAVVCAGAITLAALALPASAAVVSGTLEFSASGFPVGAPSDPVTGKVLYSFATGSPFFNAVDGSMANGEPVVVKLLELSLPGSWSPVLTYGAFGLDLFSVGHGPTTAVAAGTDDWRVAFNTVAAPTFREFTYAVASNSVDTFMTFTGQAVAVPEPATWALMVGGLGALLTARHRRRS